MDLAELRPRYLKLISYVDILLGGALLVFGTVGAVVLLQIGLQEMPPVTALDIALGLLVDGLMLVTGIILIESPPHGKSRMVGWASAVLGVAGLLSTVILISYGVTSLDQTLLIALSFTTNIVYSAAMVAGGYYLRKLL